ncbi:hypothetical protein IWW56_004641 [Coemansia sp. RSA 2131]|nr:hypothetical protein IWW56_004641 [Coemansia sp. RSA 2131]
MAEQAMAVGMAEPAARELETVVQEQETAEPVARELETAEPVARELETAEPVARELETAEPVARELETVGPAVREQVMAVQVQGMAGLAGLDEPAAQVQGMAELAEHLIQISAHFQH